MPFLTQTKTNWKFIGIVVVLALIAGGGILWFMKKQTTPITHLPQTESLGDKRYCIQESDCTLVYLGPDTCPSCAPDEYQCVSTEYYNKVLWPEWEKTHKGIVCEGCPMITEKMQCICEENVCEKKEKDETADLVPSEIEGWQTYRNEEYGFEFKYPAVFDKFEYCKIREADNFIGLGSRLSIHISDVGGLSFSEYIAKEKEKSLYEQTFPPPEEAWHEEDVYIGGIKGIRVTWFHGSRYSQIIYLLKDSTVFKIGWTAGPSCLDYYIGQGLLDEDEVQNEPYIFEQIPNTFRFLD